jgi:phage terminase small subunit
MAHKTPAHLGRKGKALWKSIVDVYDLRPDEVSILECACREEDIVERIEAELRDAPLMVAGSMGQQTAHPLISELRQHRIAKAGLLAKLKLPDEDGRHAAATTEAARAAANTRWHGNARGA